MIVRLGLIVAASLAAFTVKQLNVGNSKSGTCYVYSLVFSFFFFVNIYLFTFLEKIVIKDVVFRRLGFVIQKRLAAQLKM
jgi:hypothetical protein